MELLILFDDSSRRLHLFAQYDALNGQAVGILITSRFISGGGKMLAKGARISLITGRHLRFRPFGLVAGFLATLGCLFCQGRPKIRLDSALRKATFCWLAYLAPPIWWLRPTHITS